MQALQRRSPSHMRSANPDTDSSGLRAEVQAAFRDTHLLRQEGVLDAASAPAADKLNRLIRLSGPLQRN